MIPSTDIESILFKGRVEKTTLKEYLPEFADHWNFIRYNDFHEINWLNTPGPIYTTLTDNCGTGQPVAMNNVGGDEDYHEIIFKPPFDKQELIETLTAAYTDPLSSYYFDGNQNRTAALIEKWWAKRDKRIAYILDLYECELRLPDIILNRPLYGPRQSIPHNYRNWLDFYKTGMKKYLEWYIFKLTGQKTNLSALIFDWTKKDILDDKLRLRKKSQD